jgi:acetyl esterase
MPLDPQVQDYLTKLAALQMPPMATVSPETARALMDAETRALGKPPGVGRIVDLSIPGPAGELRIRITSPEGQGPFPGLIFFHGGGWVVGSIATHDALVRAITNEAHLAVVSVEYRLAPEHRYPAAALDAYAATAWVAAEGAAYRIDPTRLAVGGDSAGGNLAAVVALMARDRGGPPLAFQLLIYPIVSDELATPSYHDYSEGYMLTREAMEWYWDQYVPERHDRTEPYVSPLRAPDLGGLPAALVVTAEYDVLRDEAEAYARRLSEANVTTRLIRSQGLIHGFVRRTAMFDRARTALAEINAILRDALTS